MEKTNYQDSSSFFKEAIQDEIDLRDIWNGIVRKKRWFALTSGLFFLGSVIFTINVRVLNPIFRGSFTLLINDPMNTDNSKKNFNDFDSPLFSDFGYRSSNYKINTLITFLKSPIFLQPIAKEYNLTVGALKRSIKIDQASSDSSTDSKGILNVSLTYGNRKIGEKILTNLAEDYLQASLEQKQKRLTDGLNFLNTQAPQIQKRKDELQTKIVEFREKNKMIKPTEESFSLKDQQNQLQERIVSLTTEINKLKNVRKEIENGTISARGLKQELGNGLSISDFDQGLLQELINVENELAKARSKYTSSSTIVKGLKERLRKIQPSLLKNQLEAVDTALKLNFGNLDTLKLLKKDIESQFLEQPLLIKKYQNIEQELQIANDNLLSLVVARESFQLEMAQNNIPWRIISKPSMGISPIKPNIKLNLLFGLVGGLIVGAITAILRDKKDHFFHSPEEVKNDLKETILGHLPHVDIFETLRISGESILSILEKNIDQSEISSKKDSYQRFFFQEAFRNLYTSLRFLDSSKESKTILLTSSLPKEGKTLTNILLSKTLADLGVKVLLIDSDMRKPQIHVRLGINNLVGFSNLLIDPDLELENVITKVKNYKNWDVIPGGTVPPDPTRLLGSNRFKNLIKEIKDIGKYDFILIDAPPVLGLADSLLISECCDGVIILIGLGSVDRSLPKETISKIKSIGSNFYGIVSNQTIKEKSDFLKKYGYSKYDKGYGGYQSYGYTNAYNPILTYKNYAKDSDKENSDSDSSKTDFSKNPNNKFYKLIKSIKNKIKYLKIWLEN